MICMTTSFAASVTCRHAPARVHKPSPQQQPMKNCTESAVMTAMTRLLGIAALALLPVLATAADRVPDAAVGKIDGLYIEVAADVYRPATAQELKNPAAKLWADIHFTRAAAGKPRLAFVRIPSDAAFRPETGDLVQVRLTQPLHPFAYALGPMSERDTLLALHAKFFTDIAVAYDQEPAQTAYFR